MTLFELFYYAAASWYLAYAVTKTDGPFGVFVHGRDWREGRWHGRVRVIVENHDAITYEASYETATARSGLLDCQVCLSFWVALMVVIIGRNIITDALAVAGLSLWIHSFTHWRIDV